MALPWIAYLVGWCIATLFKQKHEDRVAIAIEAGIQNTGIAIYILRTTLDQPQADLTTVVSILCGVHMVCTTLAYQTTIIKI